MDRVLLNYILKNVFLPSCMGIAYLLYLLVKRVGVINWIWNLRYKRKIQSRQVFLTPTNKIQYSLEYFSKLDKAFDDKKVCNIGIMGAYGVGKSIVLLMLILRSMVIGLDAFLTKRDAVLRIG